MSLKRILIAATTIALISMPTFAQSTTNQVEACVRRVSLFIDEANNQAYRQLPSLKSIFNVNKQLLATRLASDTEMPAEPYVISTSVEVPVRLRFRDTEVLVPRIAARTRYEPSSKSVEHDEFIINADVPAFVNGNEMPLELALAPLAGEECEPILRAQRSRGPSSGSNGGGGSGGRSEGRRP